MSDHEELESSVAAWVLGALEPDEADALRAHVDGCATCREVASRLRRVVGALPLAVEEVAPPARLRERVLAAAAATRGAGVVQMPARRRRQQPRRGWRVRFAERVPLYAAAAVAVVALLAGLLIGDIAGRGLAAQTGQVARFTLSGHQDMAGSQATVIDLKSDDVALVDFRGLPALPAGRVYEVWLIPASGSPQPAAVFVPDANGAKVVLVSTSLAGYTQMAITNEPGPQGSAAPTQQPELYGKLG
jgi:anti-sigma-K factor RskA